MPIYQLTPMNLDSPNWEASTHKGPCIVRARNDVDAAATAHRAFFQAAGRGSPGDKLKLSPWTLPEEIKCTRLTDHPYEEDGPYEVVDPSHFKK